MIWDLGVKGCLRRCEFLVVTDHKGHYEIGPCHFQADMGQVGHWEGVGLEDLAGNFHWIPAGRGWMEGGYS